MMTEFEKDIAAAINRHSEENASNTPDYMLAMYLNNCLAAFNEAVQQRETWYGREIPGRQKKVLPLGRK